jgi:NADP-dependent 3-hydroxy acid dehydrogenase YdfG
MLKNKIAWVTGAGSGIGLAAAQALAAAGAAVVMSGRREETLVREAGKIQSAGGAAEIEALDVSDAQAVQQAAERIARRHGTIDILVNSAGLNSTRRFWKDAGIEDWNRVMRVNLDGTYYCTKAVLPYMRQQKGGVVINISSWAGKYISAIVGPAYTSSKHAVVALTADLNMAECVNGIRACAICPAEVDTPIMDSRPQPPSAQARAKMLQPADLGQTIMWVAAQPAHVCVNEIVISPTWNRLYLGTGD